MSSPVVGLCPSVGNTLRRFTGKALREHRSISCAGVRDTWARGDAASWYVRYLHLQYHRRMFIDTDWSQPVDFAARVAAVPRDAVVRGMFLQVIADSVVKTSKGKLTARRYVAFKTYPMREYVELLAAAAETGQPLSAAECVRRVGWSVYTSYAQTITGTAIFAIAGLDFSSVIEVAPTSYKVALTPGSVTVRSLAPQRAQVELRDIYNLPDLHQVGIWEGAMKACGVTGQIKTHVLDYGAVDFDVQWRR